MSVKVLANNALERNAIAQLCHKLSNRTRRVLTPTVSKGIACAFCLPKKPHKSYLLKQSAYSGKLLYNYAALYYNIKVNYAKIELVICILISFVLNTNTLHTHN